MRALQVDRLQRKRDLAIPSTGPETSGTVLNLGLQKLSHNGFRLSWSLSLIPGNA